MNKQREIIYAERRRVLAGQSLRDFFVDSLRDKVRIAVDAGAPEEKHPSEWDLGVILDELEQLFPVKQHVTVEDLEKLDRDGMNEKLNVLALQAYEAKETETGPELMRAIESQYIMLPIIDRMWVDHLYTMDALKTGIGLRGYGQKDPRVEYEKEAYEIFEDLKNTIADEALKAVFSFRVVVEPPPEGFDGQPFPVEGETYEAQTPGGDGYATPQFAPLPSGQIAPQPAPEPPAQPRMDTATAERLLGPAPQYQPKTVHTNRDDEGAAPRKPAAANAAAPDKVGRNDLCPCGSGKKYKKCHGTAA
jgi:preprotein translocase subunit SecA